MGNGGKRVLVAVDGSDQCYEAVAYAGRILPKQGSEVVLFHVMSRVPETFWDLEKDPVWSQKVQMVKGWETQQRYRIDRFMEDVRGSLLEAGFPESAVKIEVRERKEGLARDIAAEALKGYDAIVVGRRGLSTLQDLVLGGVATKLIGGLTDISVWLVGGRPDTDKVLIGVDPSEGAMLAVDHAGKMLAHSSCEVVLVHVVRGVPGAPEGLEDVFPEEYRKMLLDQAQSVIRPAFEEAAKRLAAAGFSPHKIETKVITGVSSRAGAIVEEARRGGYGTIVVGRRGLSKVEQFNMGRVSNKIVGMTRNRAVWVVG